MVPADVYLAARRAYVLSSGDLWRDDEAVLAWAKQRWPAVDFNRMCPWQISFWVMSQAAKDGHE